MFTKPPRYEISDAPLFPTDDSYTIIHLNRSGHNATQLWIERTSRWVLRGRYQGQERARRLRRFRQLGMCVDATA